MKLQAVLVWLLIFSLTGCTTAGLRDDSAQAADTPASAAPEPGVLQRLGRCAARAGDGVAASCEAVETVGDSAIVTLLILPVAAIGCLVGPGFHYP